jgi:glycosyltransferase involved in cell wall biosynthesis
MKDLKLCVITQPLPKIKGGHVLVSNFLKILEPLSNKIFVITANFPEDLVLDRKIHIKNVKCDSKKETMWIRTFKYILTQLRISLKLIKISKNVDIVIFFVGGMALLLPMLSAKLMRKKVVLIATGSGSESAKRIYDKRLFGTGGFIFSHILGILEKINYNLTDKIVVYSEGLVYQLGLERYKDKILPRGARFVDTELFKTKKSIHERNNLVGYIGRLSEEKGVQNLIQAIPRVLEATKDVNFLIIGDGKLRNIAEEFVSKKNIKDKISLIGWIQHDELPDYLNKLKLVVLSSYNTEGLPNVVLEAMACSTPVLATPVGAIPDIITNSETGFIMGNNNPECIVENVIRALNYPNLDEIVKNARELVEKEFTYEAAVERYRKILENI